MSNKQSLIGYCCLYCGACAIYQQMIRKRATQLLEVLDAYQFREIAKEAKEWDPKLAFYPQFMHVCIFAEYSDRIGYKLHHPMTAQLG